ncbi:ABC transporter permease [Brevundimonas sp.]|uniref:ABC transporter permease n=1 Tax=Brevundimonas sp. TaxID=1871086 RepID=UPI0028A74EB5|nr:ABC transporter permease [Brevundimonas sp.]
MPLFPSASGVKRHVKIVGALIAREMSTRFGREGIGFAWVIVEPMLFCFGVILLWTATKPEFEHGIRVAAFTMTGYMCIILLRHQISYSINALQANIGLLHHRTVRPLHIFLARNILEFAGATTAFVFVYLVLFTLGQVSTPREPLLLYGGWLLLGWLGMGLALVMSGLAMRFDFLERVIQLLTYVMIPLSGAFAMVAWLPAGIRETYLLFPLPHPIEMVRAGVFGSAVKTYYDPIYAFAWASALNIIGMTLIANSRDRIDVE